MRLLYIIGFFAVGQGLFQIFMLYKSNKSKTREQYMLLLILAFFALSIFEYSLVWSGDIKMMAHFIGFTSLFQFLFLPLIYFFFAKKDDDKSRLLRLLVHSIPFLIAFGLLAPYLLQSGTAKLNSILDIYHVFVPVLGFKVPLCMFFVIQAVVYFGLLKKLNSKNLKIYGNLIFQGFTLYIAIHIIHSSVIYFMPQLIAYVGSGVLIVSVLNIYAISYFIYKRQAVIEEEQVVKYAHSNMSKLDAQGVIDKLETLIITDNYFTNSDIRMGIVAQKINVPVQKLSQAINQIKGVSFRVYLNSYRIDYAVKHINEQKNEQVSLKEIMFDSGFNNKTTFANAFKQKMSMTPSQFLAKQRLN